LIRKSAIPKTKEEQATQLILSLQAQDFRVMPRYKWQLDGKGNRTHKVVEQVFFCSAEQITIARRFVSGFMMETDAIFNTNVAAAR